MTAKNLIIVGGANGVGKTTFAVEYAARHGWRYLGADAIAAELAPEVPERVPVAAGEELTRRLDAALEGDESVVLESTLAGRTLRHVIRRARREGFEVTIAYLFLDSVEICLRRIEERVRGGGHAVPEADVRRRFSRSIRNFWRLYRPLADDWVLIYNSGIGAVDVAEGIADRTTVRDSELYELFIRLTEGEPHG